VSAHSVHSPRERRCPHTVCTFTGRGSDRTNTPAARAQPICATPPRPGRPCDLLGAHPGPSHRSSYAGPLASEDSYENPSGRDSRGNVEERRLVAKHRVVNHDARDSGVCVGRGSTLRVQVRDSGGTTRAFPGQTPELPLYFRGKQTVLKGNRLLTGAKFAGARCCGRPSSSAPQLRGQFPPITHCCVRCLATKLGRARC
jgi:hypothetical protein